MKLLLQRYDKSDGFTTLGRLTIIQDSRTATIFKPTEYKTLEDTQRDKKIDGETRIPAGTYEIKLRDEGAMTQKYARRFPDMHAGMLWLQDVPGFKWVYGHIGNTHLDTAGCILFGMTSGVKHSMSAVENVLYESAKAYAQIYLLVSRAILSGEQVFIEILDEIDEVEKKSDFGPIEQFTQGLPKHALNKDGFNYNSIPILKRGWSADDAWCRLLVVDNLAGVDVIHRVLEELNRAKRPLKRGDVGFVPPDSDFI